MSPGLLSQPVPLPYTLAHDFRFGLIEISGYEPDGLGSVVKTVNLYPYYLPLLLCCRLYTFMFQGTVYLPHCLVHVETGLYAIVLAIVHKITIAVFEIMTLQYSNGELQV